MPQGIYVNKKKMYEKRVEMNGKNRNNKKTIRKRYVRDQIILVFINFPNDLLKSE